MLLYYLVATNKKQAVDIHVHHKTQTPVPQGANNKYIRMYMHAQCMIEEIKMLR